MKTRRNMKKQLLCNKKRTRLSVPPKIISIDFSRQANTKYPQQTNFIGKLEDDRATVLNFSLDS